MEMESLIEEALSIPLEMHVEMQAGVVTTIFGGPAKDTLYMLNLCQYEQGNRTTKKDNPFFLKISFFFIYI
jgi:hypothetical protein